MKRSRSKPAVVRLSRDAERLVALAKGLSASGSRLEDDFWEEQIAPELGRMLDRGADVSIDSALDHLYTTVPSAYDVLIDLAETHCESIVDGDQQIQLIAIPVLAWSKYAIASGELRAEACEQLKAHLTALVCAPDVKAAVAPYFYSIDQLPRRFSETRAHARQLGGQALGSKHRAVDVRHMPETAPLLADSRYLIAALAAPVHTALFRWQIPAEDGRNPPNREQVLEKWRTQTEREFAALLPGCVIDALLPDGYHTACRESDRAIRPYGIRAALAFLETALKTETNQLRAVVAPFGIERPEEYRIGFTLRNDPDVVHGVVWPLYGREEGPEPEGPQDQIEGLLRECGIGETVTLDHLQPLEYCEDCGAPMFADPLGDLVHAELPEEIEPPRAHLH